MRNHADVGCFMTPCVRRDRRRPDSRTAHLVYSTADCCLFVAVAGDKAGVRLRVIVALIYYKFWSFLIMIILDVCGVNAC
jgi:hypothetical protein